MADENTNGQDAKPPVRRARSTLDDSAAPGGSGASPLRLVFVVVPAAVLLAAVTNLLGIWSLPGQDASFETSDERAIVEAQKQQSPLKPQVERPAPEPQAERTVPKPQEERPVTVVPEKPAVVKPQPQPAATPPRRKDVRPLATRESRYAFPPDWTLPDPEPEHQSEAQPPPFDASAIVARIAGADPGEGAALFRMCGACHTSGKGEIHKVGPNLWGIVGRDIAAAPDFRYSRSLRERNGVWSYAELAAFLNDPRKHTPGTSMAFRGIEDGTRLANMLAYLRTLADDPPPLPR